MTDEKKDIGSELIELLALPANGTRLEIVFEAGKPPVIKYEYFIYDKGVDEVEVVAQFAEYELVKKE